jgi:Predicted transcriptional regulators
MRNRIKELRLKADLTQGQLGDIINISQQSVSKWELSNKELPIDMAFTIADYFNVSIEYLLCRIDEPRPSYYQYQEMISDFSCLSKRDQQIIIQMMKYLRKTKEDSSSD